MKVFHGFICDSDDDDDDSDDLIHLTPEPLACAMHKLFKGGLEAALNDAT